MNDLLELVVEQKSSDLHLQVGVPPCLRLRGSMTPIDGPELKPEDTEQLMLSTLKDGAPNKAVYREHDILMVRLDTLPGNSKTAADYFSEQFGSYVAFQSSVVEAREFRTDGYKVFVHVIFGEEKRLTDGLFMPWGSIGLMPVWEAALTEWVAPRICCNATDRALLGF